jgi:hypothetical protein
MTLLQLAGWKLPVLEALLPAAATTMAPAATTASMAS